MIRTRVGYAGGTTESPTYRSIGDHSETIQIDYDPAMVSYEELLAIFWNSHSPTARPWSQQYASKILFHDSTQEALARASRDRQEVQSGADIYTDIVAYEGFTRAEDYHQKYRLRGAGEVETRLLSLLGGQQAFVDSTIAARVNGYLGGYGDLDLVEAELERLEFPPEVQAELLELIHARR